MRPTRSLLLAVLLLGLLGLTAGPARAADAPPLPTLLSQFQAQGGGSSIQGLSVGPEVGWNAGLESLAPPSARYYRLWDMRTAWRDINPAPGVFDWSILDARVAQVESWGGKPILVLGLTPAWAAANPTAGDPRWGAGSASPPASVGYWSDYVRAVATRYAGRIGAYELWNEANLKTFWTGSVSDMADLVRAAQPIIKAAQPDAVVLAPSVTTRLASGADFTRGLVDALADGGPLPFDAFSIHSYPAGNAGKSPMQAALARFDDIHAWQQAIVTALPSGPMPGIWDTEVNYGLPGPGSRPGTSFSDAAGAELLQRTFADSQVLGVGVTVWYEFTAAAYPLIGAQFTPTTATTAAMWSRVGAGDVGKPSRPSGTYVSYDGCIIVPGASCMRDNLRGADLRQLDFTGGSLREADVRQADLTGIQLASGNLRGTFLRDSTLVGANLTKVDGMFAIFYRANLANANLSRADLRDAIFRGANVSGADLRDADLRGALLAGADLRNADLRGADLRGARLVGADLRGAKLMRALR